MNIITHEGNILMSEAEVFAHQTNCKGVMGSGVAKALRDTFPDIYPPYQELCRTARPLAQCQLIQTADGPVIANLFGQDIYGHNGQFTDYVALESALRSLRVQMVARGLKSVAMPYRMGADRGGGDWSVVVTIIERTFDKSDIDVEFWKL